MRCSAEQGRLVVRLSTPQDLVDCNLLTTGASTLSLGTTFTARSRLGPGPLYPTAVLPISGSFNLQPHPPSGV